MKKQSFKHINKNIIFYFSSIFCIQTGDKTSSQKYCPGGEEESQADEERKRTRQKNKEKINVIYIFKSKLMIYSIYFL